MTNLSRPTIFALSSGRGPAAIAVVRISGPRAGDALTALGVKTPEPRKAGLARLRDPQSGEIIDEGLVLFFPGPRSETGEDVAELQLHGGRAVVAATLAALARLEGLRMAEPGEFTRRAFENGKLDLTAVEGLADLVSAETEGQRRQAFRQMKGALGNRADLWRTRLIEALALVEARIDFSDEADVPEDLVAPALEIVRGLEAEIGVVLADGGRGERLREGMVVAIAGPPNAGKSTLLNRLARREAAIVSPYAGTTRDVIEVHLDLDGWPVTLLDTAGIRETDDPVEMEGVRRARERAAAADLVLWLEDASAAGAAHSPAPAGPAEPPATDDASRGEAGSASPRASSGPAARPPAADVSGVQVGSGAGNETGKRAAAPSAFDVSGAETRPGPAHSAAGLAGPASPIDTVREPTKSGAMPARGSQATRSAPFDVSGPQIETVHSAGGRAGPSSPASVVRKPTESEAMPARDGQATRPAPLDVSRGQMRPGAGDPPGQTGPSHWLVRTKIDLVEGQSGESDIQYNNEINSNLLNIEYVECLIYQNVVRSNEYEKQSYELTFGISGLSGAGVDRLLTALTARAQEFLAGAESALVTRERHRTTLGQVRAALLRAANLTGQEDLLAEELRTTAAALGRLTGRIDVEDILDVIFRDFCIGK